MCHIINIKFNFYFKVNLNVGSSPSGRFAFSCAFLNSYIEGLIFAIYPYLELEYIGMLLAQLNENLFGT